MNIGDKLQKDLPMNFLKRLLLNIRKIINLYKRQFRIIKLAFMCFRKYKNSNKSIDNVVWYGAYGNSNIGDSLIFYSLYNYAKKYNINITLSTREEIPVTDFGVNTFYRANKRQWIKHLKASDLFLLGGGGLFEYYSNSYRTAERTILQYLEPLVYARYYNKRYGIVGIGANNRLIPNKVLRFIFKTVCNDSYYIITRDKKSLEGFIVNGVTNVKMKASLDPVFSYRPVKKRMSETVKTIGLLLWPFHMWPYFHSTLNLDDIYQKMDRCKVELHQKFISEIRIIVEELKQQGYDILFPVFHFSDTILLKELGYEPTQINSLNSYFSAIQQCDVIITMRYHGQITSLLNNIPIISIVVQEKMDALVKFFNLDEYSLAIDRLSSSNILNIVKTISDNYSDVKDSLYAKVRLHQNNVSSDYNYFFKYILQ